MDWHKMNLEQKVINTFDKHKCECKNADMSFGCTDCLNTGFLFDSQEIALIDELNIVRKRTVHDELASRTIIMFNFWDRIKILFFGELVIKNLIKVWHVGTEDYIRSEKYPSANVYIKGFKDKFSRKRKIQFYGEHSVMVKGTEYKQ